MGAVPHCLNQRFRRCILAPKLMKKYDIKSVADALGLRFKSKSDSSSFYYYCPFCNDKRGKLNLNTENQIWRCNKCGEGGGVVSLVEEIRECSREDAREWLANNSQVIVLEEGTVIPSPNEAKSLASEKERDKTYRALLNLLELKDYHKADLIRRGLTDKAIDKFGFKSMPNKTVGNKIADKLLKEGYTLKGVPGFYTTSAGWKMQDLPGYLVPFINASGKITGMQIRVDNPGERNAKYMSLTSTGKRDGTKSEIEAHLVGFNGQNKVFITEGALKADAASYLTWKRSGKLCAFLAIPGVNNYKSLYKAFPVLKDKGVTTFYNCFDMDRVGNKDCELNINVKKAVSKIEKIVKDAGFEWKSLEWEYEKGIDDYELYLLQNSHR